MFRYLMTIWDETSSEQCSAAQHINTSLQEQEPTWRTVINRAGMRVSCIDETQSSIARILPGQVGAVLGMLFERDRSGHEFGAKPARLDTMEGELVAKTQGKWLIDNCWGNYVAIGRSQRPHEYWVIKDPVGELPCYGTRFKGVHVYFSCMADLTALNFMGFSVHEEYLRAYLASGGILVQTPSLNEVVTLGRGERIRTGCDMDHELKREQLWSPSNFVDMECLVEDADIAQIEMKSTLCNVTQQLCSTHPILLLRLSGGFDSSVIAGCLSDAPTKPHVIACTYFTPGRPSDERPWAEIVCAHTGFRHIRVPLTAADLDLTGGLKSPPSVEPQPLLVYLKRSGVMQELASNSGATAVFSGHGGDSGFGSDAIVFAPAAYLRRHGLTPPFFRLAARIAALTKRSTWAVLFNAVIQALDCEAPVLSSRQRLHSAQFVSPEIREQIKSTRVSHPWLATQALELSRRLGMLLGSPQFYNVHRAREGFVPEVIAPLYQQPVIEQFLRIPLDVLCVNGEDRGLARRAFRDIVPEPILNRRWKDRPPQFHADLIARQHVFLQEMLLDGVLASQGLLDRSALHAALTLRPTKSVDAAAEILQLLDLELWSRQWLGSSTSRAV